MNKKKQSIFDNILVVVAREVLSNHIKNKNFSYEYHEVDDNRALNGLAKRTAAAISYAVQNPRYSRVAAGGDSIITIGDRVIRKHSDEDDSITEEIAILPNKFEGYHIDSAFLHQIARNRLLEYMPGGELFTRAECSTYKTAVGNEGKERPGYSHWYHVTPIIKEIYQKTSSIITGEERYEELFPDATQKLYLTMKAALSTNIDDYNLSDLFTMTKSEYTHYFKKFETGYHLGCSVALFNLVHIDTGNDIYYINNKVDKEDKFNGFCRKYTKLGLMPKYLRKNILAGYFEYDISTAAQSLQLNIFDNVNGPYQTGRLAHPRIVEIAKQILKDYYSSEKEKAVRVTLKELISLKKTRALVKDKEVERTRMYARVKNHCTRERAKSIFTAITFGPTRGNYSKLCDEFNYSRKHGSALHDYITRFELEALLLRTVCIERFYHGDRKIAIDADIEECNAKRKYGGRGKNKKDQIMYRIYEMEESKIRNAMIAAVDFPERTTYQIHDCIITTVRISVHDLARLVEKRTGYAIKVTEEYYPMRG